MRKRAAVPGDEEEGGGFADGYDRLSHKTEQSSPILVLMAIAFALAVVYLYFFGSDVVSAGSINTSLALDATTAAVSLSILSKQQVPIASSSAAAASATTTAAAAATSVRMQTATALTNTRTASLPSGCLRAIPEIDNGKHIVAPPSGPVDLVCCVTTKGIWNIAVHKTWAPIGADNFLKMVKTGFFSSKVPLFRSLKGFLIQFGLAGDPAVQTNFEQNKLAGKHGNLPDDPPWLPLGPPGREINGVKRFQKGYLAYAGAGKNSRGTQLIIAFEDNLYLGGGSPWEVPWGQLVGDESFATLSKIYTGYGESPSQGKIRNRGKAYTEADFPLLDYIQSCQVAAVDLPWKSTVTYKYAAAAKTLGRSLLRLFDVVDARGGRTNRFARRGRSKSRV